jgi:plasmid maintenance system antidote protein VapI
MPPFSESSCRGIESYLSALENPRRVGTKADWYDLPNGHSGVSPEMSIRLEEAGWSTADHWLRMQMQYDLWDARQRAAAIEVTPFPAPSAA